MPPTHIANRNLRVSASMHQTRHDGEATSAIICSALLSDEALEKWKKQTRDAHDKQRLLRRMSNCPSLLQKMHLNSQTEAL
mmetsp:Transcript_60182/g.127492  ORF Transcript_60182/g.127492 Transcript_60182/m.127492 type:complete len:81 (+) Transcript_60182:58-300(+)